MKKTGLCSLYVLFFYFLLTTIKRKGERHMDQQKVGNFLKELRKEKNITQEQLAEILRVSRRTISRWETGSNMPDFDLLIEIADFYEVDLRDLLDGEKSSEPMDKELKETVIKVADYSNEEHAKIMKRMNRLFLFGVFASILYFISLFIEPEETNPLFDFLQGMSLGITSGMVLVGLIITSQHGQDLRALKRRLRNK